MTMSSNTTVNDSTINLASNPEGVVRSAQSQWFARPADQKYESLDRLREVVHSRRMRTTEYDTDATRFEFEYNKAAGVIVANNKVPGAKRDMIVRTDPTHYAFGQVCSLVGAPAGYFRDQLRDRPDIIVSALNHGVSKRASEGVKLMVVDRANAKPGQFNLPRLAATTSQTYGRIWDADCVDMAKAIVDRTNGKFYAPLDWSKEKRALFASDRDVFMFFIDGGSIVDGGGSRDQLNRGFFMWNSEVGSKTFGIATFLFRGVCGNFGIWGAEDVRVLKIRHTSGGPERFINEAVPALNEYVNMSAKPLEEAVRKAKALLLPGDDKQEEFSKFFRTRGFNNAEIKKAVDFADAEEGQHATLWDMYNGFTAAARHLAFAEARVDLQRRAGKLMEVVQG